MASNGCTTPTAAQGQAGTRRRESRAFRRGPSCPGAFGPGRQAFTLTELLVVIGIIVLVAGIALPMAMRAYRNADRARSAADLQAISVALTAYRQDFGDYPRVIAPNTGAATLGRALIGPGPADATSVAAYATTMTLTFGDVARNGETPRRTFVCVRPSGTPSTPPTGDSDNADWVRFPVADGVDGPGFRARPGGRVYPAYLSPDRFPIRGMVILDRNGQPILYFSARPGQNNPSVSYTGAGQQFTYDHAQNASSISLHAFRVMLGDYDRDGVIGAGEQAINAEYLLWSAGPDGAFGPTIYNLQYPPPEPNIIDPSGVYIGTPPSPIEHNRNAARRTDDITNFR